MRSGPKFEITKDMAIQNILAVAQRLGITRITTRIYQQEGSFSIRAIIRKFPWSQLVCEAGLQDGKEDVGRPRKHRQLCMQCGIRQSTTIGRTCRTCDRRIDKLNAGAMDEFNY